MKKIYTTGILLVLLMVVLQGCESSDNPPIVDNGDPVNEAVVGEISIIHDPFVISTFELDADEDPVDISTVALAI